MGGVGWLVRNGKNFVADSMMMFEDLTLQETGARFATIKSGRTAIGHDAEGNAILAQVGLLCSPRWRCGRDSEIVTMLSRFTVATTV